MKKYIAIFGLLALLLTGCSAAEETPETATTAITEATVTELPEQIISAQESTLTGSWTATLNMGAYAASVYHQELEDAEALAELYKDVQYPFTVQLELREDGSYSFAITDDGTAFETFVSSYHAIATENNLTGDSVDALRQQLAANRMDQLPLFICTSEEGNWEHNDQGLVFTNWCTVQFELDGNTLLWNSTDDTEFAEKLPLTFNKA